MYRILLITFSILISGCAYQYSFDVDKTVTPDKYAEINFSNHIKVSKIDGKKFKRKYSIWVDGSHSIKMKPGKHSFEFTFSAVSNNGGYYSDKVVKLSEYLSPGRKYEIKYTLVGSQIIYEIVEIKSY